MSHTLKYKGYDGSVEYSGDDDTLHGSVLGIRDVITYEGSTVAALKKNFAAAVDEYLQFCKEENKTPDTPYKGSFNVRVGSDLHKRAALYASEHGKKLNNVVAEALEKHLSHV